MASTRRTTTIICKATPLHNPQVSGNQRIITVETPKAKRRRINGLLVSNSERLCSKSVLGALCDKSFHDKDTNIKVVSDSDLTQPIM